MSALAWEGLFGLNYPMAELTLQYPDDLLVASGKPRSEVERELKFQLAIRLFEVGWLSLGKAAELAGWNRVQFADELGRLKIPLLNLDDEEVQTELRAIRGDHHRG
jgi:predicted HTH domain antitoxin